MAAGVRAIQHDESVGIATAAQLTGIDWVQVRAILSLQLRQGFRATTTGSGKRVHPLRQVIVVMLLFGVFFVSGARGLADLSTFLVLLFTATFAMVSLNILPDTLDARRRQLEVLGSKPISSRTLLAARSAGLLAIAGLISTCFCMAPLAAAVVEFDAPLVLIPAVYLALVAGSFSTAVFWITLLVISSRWLNLERLRSLAQLLLVGVSLGLMGLSVVSMARLAEGENPPAFSIAGRPFLHFLPSTWFANFLTTDFSLRSNLERAGVVLILATACLIGLFVDIGKRYPELADRLLAADDRPVRRPLTVRFLYLLASIPLVGRVVAPEVPTGVATLIVTATGREVVSRIKQLVPRILLIAFFFFGLSMSDPYISPSLITFYGFMMLIEGWEIVKQSPQAQASWILLTCPVDAGQLARGIRLALMLKYFALPTVLVSTTFFYYHPPLLAGILALLFVVEARVVISLLLALRPALPLSQEQVPGNAFTGFTISVGVAIVTGIGYGIVVTLERVFPYVGVAIGFCGVILLVFCGWLLERAAQSRLANIEFLN